MTRATKWIAAGLIVAVILTAISTCALRERTRSGATDAARPPRPALFAKFKGKYISPDGDCNVYVYTADPGALGVAGMWVYAQDPSAPSDFILLFNGEIDHGDAIDLSWEDNCELHIKHLSASVGGYDTTIVSVPQPDVSE